MELGCTVITFLCAVCLGASRRWLESELEFLSRHFSALKRPPTFPELREAQRQMPNKEHCLSSKLEFGACWPSFTALTDVTLDMTDKVNCNLVCYFFFFCSTFCLRHAEPRRFCVSVHTKMVLWCHMVSEMWVEDKEAVDYCRHCVNIWKWRVVWVL